MAIKLALSRIPAGYRAWSRIGIFRHGDMLNPTYALGVYDRHVAAMSSDRRRRAWTCLELGPGDSLATAFIAAADGATTVWLVDAGDFASRDVSRYRLLAGPLTERGMRPVDLSDCANLSAALARCGAKYCVNGLTSLRAIPDASVDLVLSQAVLEHVRRDDFLPTLLELRRVLRTDGVASHRVDLKDHLSSSLNSLRFSRRLWESAIFAQSGFYTNRIRFHEMLDLFERSGFTYELRGIDRWKSMPLSRGCLDQEFSSLSDDDLTVAGFDVVLRPR